MSDQSDSNSIPLRKLGGGRLRKKSIEENIIDVKSDTSLSDDEDPMSAQENNMKQINKQQRPPKKNKINFNVVSLNHLEGVKSKSIVQRIHFQKQLQQNLDQKKQNRKQQKQIKEVVQSSSILEQYENDPKFQIEDQESISNSHDNKDNNNDIAEEKRKTVKQGINNNRNKFFKHFDEEVNNDDAPIHEEEYVANEKLVFGSSEIAEPNILLGKKFFDYAQMYQQKLAVFEKKPVQQIEKPEVVSKELRRTTSLNLHENLNLHYDETELKIMMPKVGTRNEVVDATLYLNKMKQQGYQGTTAVRQTMSSLISQKSLSRNEFQQKIQGFGSKVYNIDEMMRKFQHTKFEDINKKPPQNPEFQKEEKAANSNETSDEEVQSKDLEKAAEHESYSGSDEDDDDDDDSNRSVNVINQDKSNDSIDHDKSNDSIGPNQVVSNVDEEEELISIQPKASIKFDNDSDNSDDDSSIDQEELKMFSKLRKISQIKKMKRLKLMELEEKKKQRATRILEYQKMREYVNKNFVENEAEQGSDNEDHDDVVKQVLEEDEEEVDGDLADLVDDKLADLDEENEERAYMLYLRSQREQDKNDIRRILRGEFKGRRKHPIDNLIIDNQNEQLERLNRMEECMKILQDRDDGIDEEELDEDIMVNNSHLTKNEMIQEIKQEKIIQAHKQMQNQLKQIKKNTIQQELSFIDKNIKNKIHNQTKLIELHKQNSIGAIRNSNSFLANKNHSNQQFSMFQDQNITSNSNSISLLNKQDKKPNNNFALNRLFASSQINTSIAQQLKKSPSKCYMFTKKKA